MYRRQGLIICVYGIIFTVIFISSTVFADEPVDQGEDDIYQLVKQEHPELTEAEVQQVMGFACLEHNNDWQRAVVHFKKAVALNPKLYKSWYNLGLIHIDSEEGMGYFRKAIEVDRDYSPAYYWTAYFYTRYGNFKKALPIWEEYLRVAKADKDEIEEKGRIQVASAVVEQIRSGKPGDELKAIHIH